MLRHSHKSETPGAEKVNKKMYIYIGTATKVRHGAKKVNNIYIQAQHQPHVEAQPQK